MKPDGETLKQLTKLGKNLGKSYLKNERGRSHRRDKYLELLLVNNIY